MVKKKDNKPREAEKKGESWMTEDVKVHTGLPPKVEGQLRCFCKVSVNQVIWIGASPPSTIVRIRWWGEDGDGVLFRPHDVKKSTKTTAQTTARYPVRSGPKQFAAYLSDMASLNLEVFTTMMENSQPVGTSHITQIGLLSHNRPINGFFPILDPFEKKIGELQVSVMLEPLMASFDGKSSVPTTDANTDVQKSQDSTLPMAHRPQPHSQRPEKPLEDPSISPASHTVEGRHGRQAVDIKHHLQYNLGDQGHVEDSPVAITTSGAIISMSDLQGNGLPLTSKPSAGFMQKSMPERIEDGGDLLSMLLDRGNNLRQAMVISSLSRSEEEKHSKVSLVGHHTFPAPQSMRGASAVITSAALPVTALGPSLGEASQLPVDMLFGSPLGKKDWQVLQLMNGISPATSMCSDAIDTTSEPGDPLHDHTLLHELFYKHSASDMSELSAEEDLKLNKSQSSGSLHDPGNMRPLSRSSSVSSIIGLMPEPRVLSGGKSKHTSNDLVGSVQHSRKSRSKKSNPSEAKSPKSGKSQSHSRSRSRSKSRSRSRSRSRSGSRTGSKLKTKLIGKKDSMDCVSDSDVPSTPRSEISRVSFDPVLSDAEDSEQNFQSVARSGVDGLSVERLTLLGRVHVARVNVHSLHLPSLDLSTSCVGKLSRKMPKRSGRPPRPLRNQKPCSYLVEYQFPVVATSRDKLSPNTMATEVMRVASKAVNNGVVSFGHRSVFPLLFDGTALEKWWKSALVFKVFAREKGQQSPYLVGSCGLPLKAILKSDGLQLTPELDIRESRRNMSASSSLRTSSKTRSVGTLKISVELASDHKDFATALAQTRVAELNSTCRIVPITQPSLPQPAVVQHQTSANSVIPVKEPQPHHSTSQTLGKPTSITETAAPEQKDGKNPVILTSVTGHSLDRWQQEETFTDKQVLTLHLMLMVTEGCNISQEGVLPLNVYSKKPFTLQQQKSDGLAAGEITARNTYIVCRMFWCNDTVHSAVCWGTINPCYNFSQVAPVLVTPGVLDRMRNNYMILEVWDKKASHENDKLIGIVKLSLHQFFMSFRDKKIANTLLRSQYPVIAVDNYMPIMDPFSGLQFGQISVLLAMGSLDQVNNLRRLKMEGNGTTEHVQRPYTLLERQGIRNLSEGVKAEFAVPAVEHIFEITVEGVRGFQMVESMIWGEADCFVQYYFPTQIQSHQTASQAFPMPTMKSFCTPTTLCVPDPSFNHVIHHKFALSPGIPVQRELLTACADSSGGGLLFEVWCRFYHPNIRDQLMARAMLPLAKICAMVTMLKHSQSAVQSFSLPLTLVYPKSQDSKSFPKMKDMGLIDVTVRYRSQTIEAQSQLAGMGDQWTGSPVCISVDIIRASGLRAAAEAAAMFDPTMQYPAEVGVNAYVHARLSFNEKDERVTSVVARTFSPTFSHHLEFPVPQVFSGHNDDAASLAHALESGQVELEVWHKVPGVPGTEMDFEDTRDAAGRQLIPKTNDVLLGVCTVPLASLLTHHTGITGWFPIERSSCSFGLNQTMARSPSQEDLTGSHMVGGLEVSVRFVHASDRQRVIEAALTMGWSPTEFGEEQDYWMDKDKLQQQYQLVINIDHVSLPMSCILLPGQTAPDPNACCYIRYRVYDKAAVVSRTCCLKKDGGKLLSELKHKHVVMLQRSAQLHWYLREEHLQVQAWLTYRAKDRAERPHQRDKLIGTAYFDLSSLCETYRGQHRFSKQLPLYKPGVDSLQDAFIKLRITANICGINSLDDGVMTNTILPEELTDDNSEESFQHPQESEEIPYKSPGIKLSEDVGDVGPVFTVYLSVERALHLPTVRHSSRSEEVAPTSYISFQQAGSTSPTYTDIVANSINPVWDYEAEVPLSTELLTEDSKNLVFKVWHKPEGARKQPDKSCDRVLGFVSVDLSPLRSGLQRISGWYNIVDFNGLNRGQMKVSIIPVNLQTGCATTTAETGPVLSMLSQRGASICNPPSYKFASATYEHQHDRASSKFASLPIPSAVPSAPFCWDLHTTVPTPQDSSKSVLFASLRQQLKDLDNITTRLKQRLASEEPDVDGNQPSSARSADILTGTHFGLSTIHTVSSFLGTQDESQFHSQSGRHDESNPVHSPSGTREIVPGESQSIHLTAEGDSGAFSGENTARSQDCQLSNREEVFSLTKDRSAAGDSDLQKHPPESPETLMTVEAKLSAGNVNSLCSPHDFASNSQTSQGFVTGGGVISDSASASSKGQDVGGLHKDGKGATQNAFAVRAAKEDNDTQTELQNNLEDDFSESEDDFFGSYHQYRALLDREEAQPEEGSVCSEGSVEAITPRRINDVSTLFTDIGHSNRVGHSMLPFGCPFPIHGDNAVTDFSRTYPDQQSHNKQASKDNSEISQSLLKTGRVKAYMLQHTDNDIVNDPHSFVDSWLAESSVHELDASYADHIQTQETRIQKSAKHLTQGDEKPVGDKTTTQSSRGEQTQHARISSSGLVGFSEESPSTCRSEQTPSSSLENLDDIHRGAAEVNGRAVSYHDVISNGQLGSAPGANPLVSSRTRLLSNVELDSVSSSCVQHVDWRGDGPSHQSSVNGHGFYVHHAPSPEKEEEGADSSGHEDDKPSYHSQQPLSSRSLKVSDFLSGSVPRGADSGHCESSEDEFVCQPQAAADRTRDVTSRSGKRNGSLTASSDPPATEDSGLESGAKSSQDERDNASIPDPTFCNPTSDVFEVRQDFFLSMEDLQASMHAVQLASRAAASTTTRSRAQVSRDIRSKEQDASQNAGAKQEAKFTGIHSMRNQQLPTADEVKRIARIFSTKIS